mgnify:CR=1 FL=1
MISNDLIPSSLCLQRYKRTAQNVYWLLPSMAEKRHNARNSTHMAVVRYIPAQHCALSHTFPIHNSMFHTDAVHLQQRERQHSLVIYPTEHPGGLSMSIVRLAAALRLVCGQRIWAAKDVAYPNKPFRSSTQRPSVLPRCIRRAAFRHRNPLMT